MTAQQASFVRCPSPSLLSSDGLLAEAFAVRRRERGRGRGLRGRGRKEERESICFYSGGREERTFLPPSLFLFAALSVVGRIEPGLFIQGAVTFKSISRGLKHRFHGRPVCTYRCRTCVCVLHIYIWCCVIIHLGLRRSDFDAKCDKSSLYRALYYCELKKSTCFEQWSERKKN